LRARVKPARLVFTVALAMVFASVAFAGNTGIISGLVTDENGKGVSGALVVVKGVNMFATTNADGYYVINGVPVGYFDVKASRVGYSEMTTVGVKVVADLRTNVSFQLQSEITGETRIQSEKPLIEFKETAKKDTIDSDAIEKQVVEEFADMLARTPGIVYEDSDASTLNLHIRGGRGNEIAYIIDGVTITNPIVGGAGMQVPTDAIAEIAVIKAGWDAEYGEAQSGIINITTKEGRDTYTGNVNVVYEVYTGKHDKSSHKYLEATGLEDADVPLVTWETDSRQTKYSKVSGSFAGPIVNPYLSYYVGGDYMRDWTIYPLPDPDTEWNANAKLTIKPTGRNRISLSAGKYREDHDYFDVQYQYVLEDHYEHRMVDALRLSGKWTHNVTNSAFYEVTGGMFREHRKRNTDGKFWTDYYRDPPNPQSDPTGWFITDGDWPFYQDRYQQYYNVKGDFTYNMARITEGGGTAKLAENQIKCGGDVKLYDLDFYEVYAPSGNIYTDVYYVDPRSYAAFIQDKLEYSGMIINVGVRFDMFDPNTDYPIDPWDFRYAEDGTPINSDSPYEDYWDTPRKIADKSYQLSPRIGVSYPITDRDKLHFSYGHFFQTPPFAYLYESTQLELNTSGYPLMGNPDLNPQKTIQYEIGVEHLFTDTLKADVSAYFKDIKDLLDTERIDYEGGQNYTRYINADFGSVRGLEVAIDQRVTRDFSGSVGYTFSVAKGLASDIYQGYNYSYRTWTAPVRENLLDWDQTHTLDVMLDYRTNRKNHNFGVNTTIVYGSGMPYSKPKEGSGQPEVNTERMPWTMDWNIKFNYDVKWLGLNYSAYCEVLNILNRRNVYNFGMDEGDGAGSDWIPYYYFYGDEDGPYDDLEVYGDPMRLRVGFSVGF
jgi:outer membrane receptor for ferrienterochelin and colicin